MSSDPCPLSSQRSWTRVKETRLQLVSQLCKGSLPGTHSWLAVWLQGRTQWNCIYKEVQKVQTPHYSFWMENAFSMHSMFNGASIKLTWTTQDILHYIYKSNERALLWNTNSFKHSYLCTCHFTKASLAIAMDTKPREHLVTFIWKLRPTALKLAHWGYFIYTFKNTQNTSL